MKRVYLFYQQRRYVNQYAGNRCKVLPIPMTFRLRWSVSGRQVGQIDDMRNTGCHPLC